MMRKLFLSSILCLTLSTGYAGPEQKATLEITFTGLRNGKGDIQIGISNTEEGWPRKPHREIKRTKTNGNTDRMTVRIEGLEYGKWAVSVLDDVNSNRNMDTFMGIPREGYGFTNNPKVRLSAPGFEDCAIILDKPLVQVTINIQYWSKEEIEE